MNYCWNLERIRLGHWLLTRIPQSDFFSLSSVLQQWHPLTQISSRHIKQLCAKASGHYSSKEQLKGLLPKFIDSVVYHSGERATLIHYLEEYQVAVIGRLRLQYSSTTFHSGFFFTYIFRSTHSNFSIYERLFLFLMKMCVWLSVYITTESQPMRQSSWNSNPVCWKLCLALVCNSKYVQKWK